MVAASIGEWGMLTLNLVMQFSIHLFCPVALLICEILRKMCGNFWPNDSRGHLQSRLFNSLGPQKYFDGFWHNQICEND